MFHIRVMSPRRPIPTVALLAEAQLLGSFYSRPTPSASQGLRVSGLRTNRARKEEPMRRPVNSRPRPARPGVDRASPGVVLGSRLGLRPVTPLTKWNAVWATSRINPMVAGLSTRQS